MAQRQTLFPASLPSSTTTATTTTPTGRQTTRTHTAHANSSAFCSSANPDEDWTKISDLAERRRIQNRIAQRNYRKKLKARLEDLEARASASDRVSPTPKTAKGPATKSKKSPKARAKRDAPAQPAVMPPTPRLPQCLSTPPMQSHDMDFARLSPYRHDDRRSHSPFASLPYSYPHPPPQQSQSYSAAESYGLPLTTSLADEIFPHHDDVVALTADPHFRDAFKREPSYGDDESLAPSSYLDGYGSYFQSQNDAYSYASSMATTDPCLTPPMTHSFNHYSTAAYPTWPVTPPSIPSSPALMQS